MSCELGAVAGHDGAQWLRELIRLEQRAFELAEHVDERLAVAGKPSRGVLVALRERPSDERPSRGLADHRASATVRCGERFEESVERPDGAGEQSSRPSDEPPLDDLDLGLVRDDQPGIAIEQREIPLEEERNLAGMSRTDDERESHPSMVVGRSPTHAAVVGDRGTGDGVAATASTSACDRDARPPHPAFHPRTNRRDQLALHHGAHR